MNYDDRTTLEDAWREEVELFECEPEDWDTAGLAELADELDLYRIQAAEDPKFWDTYDEWSGYICDNNLLLALEQCCHDSVLLPKGQRELRVLTCPEVDRYKLGFFLRHCPIHVQHYLALYYWALVRIERARRNGNAEWRPESSEVRSALHDTVFFPSPILNFRKYWR